jgi:uncharacterized protein (TIGR03067 family)
MRIHTLLLAALCATTLVARSGAHADEPALSGDLAKLQGEWTAMFGPQKNIPMVLKIEGNSVTLQITTAEGQQRESKGEIKLDEKAKPHKTIDWVKFTTPSGEPAPANRGIYMLSGDSITVCNGGPGNERPTEFKAGQGGPPQLLTLNRKLATPSAAELTGDLAKLQGHWSGKAGREQNVAVTVTIQGTSAAFSFTGPRGQRQSKGEFKLDENAKPHKTLDWVNFTTSRGENAQPSLAIYTLKGDTLTLCNGGPGNERPTEFKAGEMGRPSLMVLTKE